MGRWWLRPLCWLVKHRAVVEDSEKTLGQWGYNNLICVRCGARFDDWNKHHLRQVTKQRIESPGAE